MRQAGRAGFIWNGAGNIVTNNHVVSGTSGIVVRLASGEVMAAEIVGTAPNYDHAVIRLRNPQKLPSPVAIGSSADLRWTDHRQPVLPQPLSERAHQRLILGASQRCRNPSNKPVKKRPPAARNSIRTVTSASD
jgi:S1-C subfamily serine protease